MPWPDPDRIRAAWPSTEGVPLSCFVYGQGFCGSDQSYFPDFEKRALIASWLTEAGVDVRFPETEVPPGVVDFLAAQIELASHHDLIVALQPKNTLLGAPTLRSELHDVASRKDLREKTWLFCPESGDYATFEAIVSRLNPEHVVRYSDEMYDCCTGIRDRLTRIIEVVRFSKL